MLPPVSNETKQTNYDMYRHIITTILALVALTANGQKTVIEGTVLDAQGKKVDAYVTVAPKTPSFGGMRVGASSVLPTPTLKDTTN